MEMKKKIMASGDRLSDLPESILLHILSMLPSKEVVRSSVLSTRWQFLWKSVPVSITFLFSGMSFCQKNITDFLDSANKELYYWRSSEKIRTFKVFVVRYKKCYVKDVDLWVHFATKDVNVESFTLHFFDFDRAEEYEFPQFAYKNTSLRNLGLRHCGINPSVNVNWRSLVSLSLEYLELTDGVMKKVLSGCPNLECLKLEQIWGIYRLEISSVKLRKLIIEHYQNENNALWLEILAPYVQNLQLVCCCDEIRLQQRNVPSLVNAVLDLSFDFEDEDEEDNLEKECSYWKELLQSVAHVENLELGPWCIEYLSILELKGWKSPPSSRKSLKLNEGLEPLDFPGICSFLQSSLDLEKLVIDWYNYQKKDMLLKYTNRDEQIKRFETHNFNCSLPHLKTIKFINFLGPLSENKSVLPLVKYLLKNATALEKFIIVVTYQLSDVDEDYVKMEQEFLSFPRSSPHASIVFSY